MFTFARYSASVATDALSIVDYKAIFHQINLIFIVEAHSISGYELMKD